MVASELNEEHLRSAHELVGLERLDFTATMTFLNRLPSDMQVGTDEALRRAREAVAAAPGGDHRHEAIARYAVARLLVFLERDRSRPA